MTSEFSASDHTTQGFATAGLGMRYSFGRHFEAVGDVAWNHNFHEASPDLHQQVTGSRYGLTRSTNIGVRYRFNLHKPKAKA